MNVTASASFPARRIKIIGKEIGKMALTAVCAAAVLIAIRTLPLPFTSSPSQRTAKRSSEMFGKGAKPAMVGMPLVINGATFAPPVAGVVIVTDPLCRSCERSLAFHQRVVQAATAKHFQVLIAVPDSASDRRFGTNLGVPAEGVIGWRDLSVSVIGTPSILVVGPDGVIRTVWVGRLDPKGEEIVMALLTRPSLVGIVMSEPGSLRSARELQQLSSGSRITPNELTELEQTTKVTVIDVRERDAFYIAHRAEAINVPLPELALRAPNELLNGASAVVECSTVRFFECERATKILASAGYHTVLACNRNAYIRTCEASLIAAAGPEQLARREL